MTLHRQETSATNPLATRPRWVLAAALAAMLFGVVAVAIGGKTLFGGPAERAAAGNIVPFVLWFNFLAGFAYVVTGYGVLRWKRWAAQSAAAIAAATVAVFIALGIHIWVGGAFEMRTIGAMAFRSLVWIALAITLGRLRPQDTRAGR
jgi:hypothetical protein